MSKNQSLCHCATASGAAMPAPRRPLLTQILSPEFRPDLALQVIARLDARIAELEQTLAEARS
jgi:hypothetical protein